MKHFLKSWWHYDIILGSLPFIGRITSRLATCLIGDLVRHCKDEEQMLGRFMRAVRSEAVSSFFLSSAGAEGGGHLLGYSTKEKKMQN